MTTLKKNNPFDVVNALSEIRPLTYQELEKKGNYDTFLVNRSLSLSQDTVLTSAIMNERSHLDKDIQATFYINTIRPRRRWSKWPKQRDIEKSTIIANYYGMSVREAKLYSDMHTEEQIEKMKKMLTGSGKSIRTNT